jgi:hypothetical protein
MSDVDGCDTDDCNTPVPGLCGVAAQSGNAKAVAPHVAARIVARNVARIGSLARLTQK